MPSEATRAKELAGLIERVEAATGGHGEAATDLRREIEYRIVSLLISPQEALLHEIHGIADYRVTTSVDAALALVERVLPGWSLRLCVHPTSAYVDIYRLSDLTHFPEGGIERRIASPYYDGQFIQHRLPALAICLALLRALSQESQDAQ